MLEETEATRRNVHFLSVRPDTFLGKRPQDWCVQTLQDLQEYLSLLIQSLSLNVIKRVCGPGQVAPLVRVVS